MVEATEHRLLGVALWLFTRDYRAHRCGVPGATKPSLLGILASMDFLADLSNCLDYGHKAYHAAAAPTLHATSRPLQLARRAVERG
jgi:hypothetical protein